MSDLSTYNEAIQRLLQTNDSRDAREWLDEAGKHYGVIHELTRSESIEVVETAFSRGAVEVLVLGEIPKDLSESSVDMLLIKLPKNPPDRVLLFDFEAQVAAEHGFDGCVDEGQDYLLLRWT